MVKWSARTQNPCNRRCYRNVFFCSATMEFPTAFTFSYAFFSSIHFNTSLSNNWSNIQLNWKDYHEKKTHLPKQPYWHDDAKRTTVSKIDATFCNFKCTKIIIIKQLIVPRSVDNNEWRKKKFSNLNCKWEERPTKHMHLKYDQNLLTALSHHDRFKAFKIVT